jgi:LysM domain
MSKVTIECPALGLAVRAYMGEEAPTMGGGYGGWEMTARPRRVSITTWPGHDPLQMSLALRLDGWIDNRSIEGDCRNIERMALPPRDYTEPPSVFVSRPAPHPEVEWKIQELLWGESLRARDGDRRRQDVTLSLLQFIDTDRVQTTTAAERARNAQRSVQASATSRTYTVKDGDTLGAIAETHLHSWTRWSEIADLNDIRDPLAIRPGDVITLP